MRMCALMFRLCVHPCVRHIGLLFAVTVPCSMSLSILWGDRALATSCLCNSALYSLLLFVPCCLSLHRVSLFIVSLFTTSRVEPRSFTRTETLVPRNSTTYSKGALLENVLSSIVYLYYYKYEEICASVPVAHQPSITTIL